jgi:hypothetical protein
LLLAMVGMLMLPNCCWLDMDVQFRFNKNESWDSEKDGAA